MCLFAEQVVSGGFVIERDGIVLSRKHFRMRVCRSFCRSWLRLMKTLPDWIRAK